MAQKMLKYWFQYLRDFWRPLEMPFISCEISFLLTRSKTFFLVVGTVANQESTFTITVQNFLFQS